MDEVEGNTRIYKERSVETKYIPWNKQRQDREDNGDQYSGSGLLLRGEEDTHTHIYRGAFIALHFFFWCVCVCVCVCARL